ncbi:hypothetical protein A2159_01235 [Candidatus Woesebacteria bacterium RBG_13_34_9]|uniref:Type II secretion system protein GspG C-terminal domain-containing protein n=1 Tax=Candidatus Woesebacteria bacterium RBG_13_34_9 TaxID=1802477 RepID=A0A1F7X1P0_9BACT|nr:MAG: hypothetical protein A2159_01235 [Candidatus Woesebacteria bacterium RBG_13_34_9]
MEKKLFHGFTLIELLVIMAVISTLATVLFVIVNPAEMTRRARDSRRISDLSTIKRAIDLAIADKKVLPDTSGFINVDATSDVGNFGGSGFDLHKYLSVIPQDPKNGATGNVQVIGASCTKGSVGSDTISYKFWSDGDTYILKSYLESLTNCETVQNDGNNNATYELGTEPGLDAI